MVAYKYYEFCVQMCPVYLMLSLDAGHRQWPREETILWRINDLSTMSKEIVQEASREFLLRFYRCVMPRKMQHLDITVTIIPVTIIPRDAFISINKMHFIEWYFMDECASEERVREWELFQIHGSPIYILIICSLKHRCNSNSWRIYHPFRDKFLYILYLWCGNNY